MTRDEVRAAWAASGLTYVDLSRYDLEILRNYLGKAMRNSCLMEGYAANRAIKVVNWPKGWAALTCRSFYFEKREAVTFNDNGFIGFAGWADETNVQPILAGFTEWLGERRK